MNYHLIAIGKTAERYYIEGENEYLKRLKRYCKLNYEIIPGIKGGAGKSENEIKKEEGKAILKKINSGDFLILLDEQGTEVSSVEFSEKIEHLQLGSHSDVKFVIGGAYGFSEDVYNRSDLKVSLSRMTFSHQMVRVIFLEQLYRAFTIIRREPYHHR
jgi:23S rRNA (pseudouridine1915-N3)-methyltransferase